MTVDFSNPGFWLRWWCRCWPSALRLRKPGQDAAEQLVRFKAAAAETDGVLKGRLDVLEERVKHMPTTEELREVEGQLSAIKAEMGGLKDAVQSTRSGVIRIEEFLRSKR